MPSPIFILNGPNLNLLGRREPHIYGHESLEDVRGRCERRAQQLGCAIDFRQSNHEGVLIDWVQEARTAALGLVINPGGYSHTSVALMDALKALEIPVIECHLSNPAARENFRHRSFVSLAATGTICGLGPLGYELAIEAIAARAAAAPQS
ncbi:MAG TPA: type II 3-dehydroquinate dehydratase [Caulobacteraceae bacterium]|jgi:3-dehydroquinate dehydratase-2|nr:type II 3-dehydroquinate dehydratase [Caulobacteraceae bacterium]